MKTENLIHVRNYKVELSSSEIVEAKSQLSAVHLYHLQNSRGKCGIVYHAVTVLDTR